MESKLIKIFFTWLPFAVITVCISGLVYVAVQQNYRTDLNDPQVAMSHDAAAAIMNGANPPDLIPTNSVDLSWSLSPFIGIYDKDGKPVKVNGKINGQDAQPPSDAIKASDDTSDRRFTWQPNASTRIALVVVPVPRPSNTVYVVSGRNMKEVESRIKTLTAMSLAAMIITLLASLLAVIIKIAYFKKIKKIMARQPETIIEWQAPEFRHYPKNAAWFITFGIIVAFIIAYQIFQHDWFGAITIVIIAGLFGAFAMHKPKMVTISISTHGLHIDNTHIPYSRIKQFWIIDNDNHKTLNIETTAYLNHLLSIELDEQDSEEVQEILAELLPEKEESEETVAQRIAHRFKF